LIHLQPKKIVAGQDVIDPAIGVYLLKCSFYLGGIVASQLNLNVFCSIVTMISLSKKAKIKIMLKLFSILKITLDIIILKAVSFSYGVVIKVKQPMDIIRRNQVSAILELRIDVSDIAHRWVS
jgi:hypothetical protein